MKNAQKLLSLFALLVVVLSISIASVTAGGPLTVISGTVTDANSAVVSGADVKVTCTHNAVETVNNVQTGANGKYYAYFDPVECDDGDSVFVEASYAGESGSNDGLVSYSGVCLVNVGLIDVQIPEFGVVAAGLALVGAVAGFAVMRRKN